MGGALGDLGVFIPLLVGMVNCYGHCYYRQPDCPRYRSKRYASFVAALTMLRRESPQESLMFLIESKESLRHVPGAPSR